MSCHQMVILWIAWIGTTTWTRVKLRPYLTDRQGATLTMAVGRLSRNARDSNCYSSERFSKRAGEGVTHDFYCENREESRAEGPMLDPFPRLSGDWGVRVKRGETPPRVPSRHAMVANHEKLLDAGAGLGSSSTLAYDDVNNIPVRLLLYDASFTAVGAYAPRRSECGGATIYR